MNERVLINFFKVPMTKVKVYIVSCLSDSMGKDSDLGFGHFFASFAFFAANPFRFLYRYHRCMIRGGDYFFPAWASASSTRANIDFIACHCSVSTYLTPSMRRLLGS